MPAGIYSWNVNGIRSVMQKGFLDWLDRERPEVLCIQESRVMPEELTDAQRAPKGYTSFWMPAEKKGYSGTAVYTRKEPLSVSPLGVEEFDAEGRAQFIEFRDFTVVNCYFPNSQPERKRLAYKLDFVKAVRRTCDGLVRKGKNVVLCGDYNIAHTEFDLARPKQNEDTPGYYAEERAAMTAFLKGGYVDTFRHFCPDPGHYSWWSYRGNARAGNVGWRIDYHCVNEGFLPRVKSAAILNKVTGSDHCPVAVRVT
jgi:exodeoxyribonuclease-3